MARLVGIALAAVLVSCLWAAALAYAGGGGYGVMDSVAAAASSARTCHGTLGQCAVGEDEELGTPDEALLRRSLAARKPTNRYISYAALRADQVPCSKRGRSYYDNCASQQPANPYRRGCSAITRCSRNMN